MGQRMGQLILCSLFFLSFLNSQIGCRYFTCYVILSFSAHLLGRSAKHYEISSQTLWDTRMNIHCYRRLYIEYEHLYSIML